MNTEQIRLFEDLYERKIKAVKGFCGRYANRHEAEELAHDIFANLYEHLDRFRNESSLDTWLYKSTLNACYNRVRYRNQKKRVGITYSLNSQNTPWDDKNVNHSTLFNQKWLKDKLTDVQRDIENREILAIVKGAISNLGPVHRECILTFMQPDGFDSYENVAKKLGVPVNTVRSRLTRARMHLKTELKKKKYGSIV